MENGSSYMILATFEELNSCIFLIDAEPLPQPHAARANRATVRYLRLGTAKPYSSSTVPYFVRSTTTHLPVDKKYRAATPTKNHEEHSVVAVSASYPSPAVRPMILEDVLLTARTRTPYRCTRWDTALSR